MPVPAPHCTVAVRFVLALRLAGTSLPASFFFPILHRFGSFAILREF